MLIDAEMEKIGSKVEVPLWVSSAPRRLNFATDPPPRLSRVVAIWTGIADGFPTGISGGFET